MVNSPADGYTLLYIGASAVVNVSLFDNLPFNLLRDIAPVSGMIDFPLVMIVNPSLPAKTVAEFIAYAKTNSGRINMASFGTGYAGSNPHGPNENIRVDDFLRTIKLIGRVIHRLK